MKSIVVSICTSIACAAPCFIFAQEAADLDLASKRTEQNNPTPTPASVPELSQLDEAFKQPSMGKAGDELRLQVEWRQLRNKVANDPDLIAAKKAAEAARTDLEKRERLRGYYKLYYARIRRLPMSPAMKPRLDAMESANVGRTAQSRVRPGPSATPTKPH
ncbi:MAG: hypothetical protein QOE73_1503 [Verrucomicrobiota bacterium]|jgi:hypothetical protein